MLSLFAAELVLRQVLKDSASAGVLPGVKFETDRAFTRVSDYDPNLFEMLPSITFGWDGVNTYRTNSAGLRGPEFAAEKAPGVRRVLAIGDSITFGIFIGQDERTFPMLLQSSLNEHFPAEVINAGVSGYQAAQYASYFYHRGAALKPDLLLINYAPWDCTRTKLIDDPGYRHYKIMYDEGVFYPDALPLPRAVSLPLLRNSLLARAVNLQLWRHGDGAEAAADFEHSNFTECAETFRSITDRAKRMGAAVLFVVHPLFTGNSWQAQAENRAAREHRQLGLSLAQELNLEIVDILPVYAAATDSPQQIAIDIVHPNALGNRLIAGAIVEPARRVLSGGSN